ncbi:MAG TPA: YggT family protein [Nitrospiria bacterium]|nr:YggT family protein [Nitrospiria bacterium]
MFVMGNFIRSIAIVLDYVLQIYTYIIVARALVSWVNPDPYNPIVQFLHKVTEPVLAPFRQLTGTYRTGIDLSPILVILVIFFLRSFLVQSLYQLAIRLG